MNMQNKIKYFLLSTSAVLALFGCNQSDNATELGVPESALGAEFVAKYLLENGQTSTEDLFEELSKYIPNSLDTTYELMLDGQLLPLTGPSRDHDDPNCFYYNRNLAVESRYKHPRATRIIGIHFDSEGRLQRMIPVGSLKKNIDAAIAANKHSSVSDFLAAAQITDFDTANYIETGATKTPLFAKVMWYTRLHFVLLPDNLEFVELHETPLEVLNGLNSFYKDPYVSPMITKNKDGENVVLSVTFLAPKSKSPSHRYGCSYGYNLKFNSVTEFKDANGGIQKLITPIIVDPENENDGTPPPF